MKKQITVIFVLLLLFSVLLTACNRHDNRASSKYVQDTYADYEVGYAMSYMSNAVADVAAPLSKSVSPVSTGYDVDSADNATASQKRMIRKSASLNIQVADPIDASAKISALADEMGGFVVSSTNTQEYYNSEISLPKANLSIRVPAERLNEMIDFVESLTSDSSKYVSNKRIYGTDITSDYVDTKSRLASLEKTRDKLYEIMDTAANAEEALEIYNRISEVETDIEVYKGQIKYMEESVALSSIEIQISSIRPAPIHTVQVWSIGEVISDAFESLLDSCKDVIEILINLIIVVIPVIIIIALPIALIVFLAWKLIRKKKAKKAKIMGIDPVEKAGDSKKQE